MTGFLSKTPQELGAYLRELADRVAQGLTEPMTLENTARLARDAFELHEEAELIGYEALGAWNGCGENGSDQG